MPTITRLRPRRAPRQLELLREALDLGGWSEQVRVELTERLERWSPDQEPRWSFVMTAARKETVMAFLAAVRSGPRALATLSVWNALPPYVRADTGEVVATQRTLAKTAGVTQGDVYRALQRLVEMGALLKEDGRRGRYYVHPQLLWRGELGRREGATVTAPELRLVD